MLWRENLISHWFFINTTTNNFAKNPFPNPSPSRQAPLLPHQLPPPHLASPHPHSFCLLPHMQRHVFASLFLEQLEWHLQASYPNVSLSPNLTPRSPHPNVSLSPNYEADPSLGSFWNLVLLGWPVDVVAGSMELDRKVLLEKSREEGHWCRGLHL